MAAPAASPKARAGGISGGMSNDDDGYDDEPAMGGFCRDDSGSWGRDPDVKEGPLVVGPLEAENNFLMNDGAPPPWKMVGGSRLPIGLQHHDHCRLAASIFGDTAHRLQQVGMLQRAKTLAIL